MAIKILIGNYKGGVGKTISSAILGTLFAKESRVLLIDLDPQSSLSEICLKNKNIDFENYEYYKNKNYMHFLNYAYDVFSFNLQNSYSLFKILIKPFNILGENNNRLDILPNSLFYKRDEEDINELGLDDICINLGNNSINLFALPKIINDNSFDDTYDYIIFDTPPSSNQITQSAFLLADRLLIPTIMDRVSEIGVKHYWNKINKIYEKYCSPLNKDYSHFKYAFGDKIVPLGIFETMRQGMSSNVENAVRNSLNTVFQNGFKIFDSKIKELNDVLIYAYDLQKIYTNNTNIGEGVGRSIDTRGYIELYKEIKEELICNP